jgi:hypothetical protein
LRTSCLKCIKSDAMTNLQFSRGAVKSGPCETTASTKSLSHSAKARGSYQSSSLPEIFSIHTEDITNTRKIVTKLYPARDSRNANAIVQSHSAVATCESGQRD